jgi:hypothetical protein
MTSETVWLDQVEDGEIFAFESPMRHYKLQRAQEKRRGLTLRSWGVLFHPFVAVSYSYGYLKRYW